MVQRNHFLKLAFVLILVAAGCASTGQQDTSSSSDSNYMTLEDHLRRISGVTVIGGGYNAKVIYRGTGGISNASRGMGAPENKKDINLGDSDQKQPLFVLDGEKLGRNFSNIRNLLAPGEIESVNFLTPAEATMYGGEGGWGVIEITSKSSKRQQNDS